MRIGFISPFAKINNANYGSEHQVGAIEHQLFGLAKEMSSMGHEVFIVRNWCGLDEQVIDDVNFININLFKSSGQGFNDSVFPLNHLSHLRYAISASKALSKKKLEVTNVSRVFSGLLALRQLRKNGTHCVFITHDNDIFVTPGLGHRRVPYIPAKVLYQVNKHYDATVATTSGVKEYLEGLGLSCQAVITEAIDPSKYQMSKKGKYILSAARLVPHKRLQDLIAAYSKISDGIKEDLVIIGSGPCEESLKSFAHLSKSKDRIHFIPFLPKTEYRKYLSECSAFVLPSVAEAFGVVIIEAMASGKPVLVRNIVGPRDIVTDGYNGMLFNSTTELSERLKLILIDEPLKKKMGKNARNTVEKKYAFSVAAKEYVRLYERLCI